MDLKRRTSHIDLTVNQSKESKENTSEFWEKYYPTFDSTTEYLFINNIMTIMHGYLPSYAYYTSNSEAVNFWNELEDDKYPIIFNYLIENEFINFDIDEKKMSYKNTIIMKNEVLNFVFLYFNNY